MKYLVSGCLLCILWGGRMMPQEPVPEAAPEKLLSGYGLFKGNPADQVPAEGVRPYSLNTPLFSDYAEKLRFVRIPAEAAVDYHPRDVLQFPQGTILVKTFYYPVDFRDPSKGRRLLETRLLIHEANGWKAYTYVWKEDMTDAVLEVAGEEFSVDYTYTDGKKYSHRYVVPNQNQCKGCHNNNNAVQPIGPTARQLNGAFRQWGKAGTGDNQLVQWQEAGLITGLPPVSGLPAAADWQDESQPLDARARAWLDINCAHCHRAEGPASTSGLFLGMDITDPVRLGINKTPVAAGRGSGNRKFDIVKGKPDASILIYRMESGDPGVMMPELGRQVPHREGISLIREWIRKMP